MGRLTGAANQDGNSQDFVYDTLGNLTNFTDFDGVQVEFAYDELGVFTGDNDPFDSLPNPRESIDELHDNYQTAENGWPDYIEPTPGFERAVRALLGPPVAAYHMQTHNAAVVWNGSSKPRSITIKFSTGGVTIYENSDFTISNNTAYYNWGVSPKQPPQGPKPKPPTPGGGNSGGGGDNSNNSNSGVNNPAQYRPEPAPEPDKPITSLKFKNIPRDRELIYELRLEGSGRTNTVKLSYDELVYYFGSGIASDVKRQDERSSGVQSRFAPTASMIII
jgi:YD repeat-containing protein